MNVTQHLPSETISSEPITNQVIIRWLGRQTYEHTWQAMRQFTDERTEQTPDEIWFLEHDPVFTQGQNGKPEHILDPGSIPIVKTDRGGQVTYHGPGQLMVYTLIDLKRKKMQVREFVSTLEKAVIDFLQGYKIVAHAKIQAPGVYIESEIGDQKICSIGLRLRRGCSYHGIAFNIDMDLSPFERINPCGFKQLQMTQLRAFAGPQVLSKTAQQLTHPIMQHLRYTHADFNAFPA